MVTGVYGVILAVAALWAWVVDVSMRGAVKEHMLPDICLEFVTAPMSLTLGALHPMVPTLFDAPFAQIGYMTLCGGFQFWILWRLTGRRRASV